MLKMSKRHSILDDVCVGLLPVSADRQEKSYELVCEAQECDSLTEQNELLSEALEKDPRNTTAMLGLLDALYLEPDSMLGYLRNIHRIARENLGEAAFKELEGNFWVAHETRPYMYASEQLGQYLVSCGFQAEAITLWNEMLRLNPADNQGVRYSLLCAYFQTKQIAEASELLQRCDEARINTLYAYLKVLERLIVQDEPGARNALAIARTSNPYTEDYLLGLQMPTGLPVDSYQLGSRDEANVHAFNLKLTWCFYPTELEWLEAQMRAKLKNVVKLKIKKR